MTQRYIIAHRYSRLKLACPGLNIADFMRETIMTIPPQMVLPMVLMPKTGQNSPE